MEDRRRCFSARATLITTYYKTRFYVRSNLDSHWTAAFIQLMITNGRSLLFAFDFSKGDTLYITRQ